MFELVFNYQTTFDIQPCETKINWGVTSRNQGLPLCFFIFFNKWIVFFLLLVWFYDNFSSIFPNLILLLFCKQLFLSFWIVEMRLWFFLEHYDWSIVGHVFKMMKFVWLVCFLLSLQVSHTLGKDGNIILHRNFCIFLLFFAFFFLLARNTRNIL